MHTTLNPYPVIHVEMCTPHKTILMEKPAKHVSVPVCIPAQHLVHVDDVKLKGEDVLEDIHMQRGA